MVNQYYSCRNIAYSWATPPCSQRLPRPALNIPVLIHSLSAASAAPPPPRYVIATAHRIAYTALSTTDTASKEERGAPGERQEEQDAAEGARGEGARGATAKGATAKGTWGGGEVPAVPEDQKRSRPSFLRSDILSAFYLI